MSIFLKKLICTGVALFIFGGILPGESKEEKDVIGSLLKRAARSISGLAVSEDGKVVKGKQRAIRRLRRMIKSSDSELQKSALADVVKRLREDNLSKFPEPEFIPGTAFDLLIRYNRKKRAFSVTALITAVGETRIIDSLFKKFRDALKGGAMERNVRFFPPVNVIRISLSLFPEKPVPELLMLPSAGAGLEMYPGVILMYSRIKKEFVTIIQPMATKVYTKKSAQKIGTESLMRNIFLRHAAHYTIPVEIEEDGEKRKTKVSGLKELFPVAEEIRADLTYLALIARMSEKGLVDDKLKEEVVLTFLLQKLADMNLTRENSPSVALLTALYNKGGIKVGKNQKKLVVELDLLIRSIKNLESGFADLFSRGSYTECSAFFKKNREIPQNIKELIDTPGQKETE